LIKLYTWGTPNGTKVVILLEETGADYELIPVDLSKGQQRDPAFLELNPNGKIPAIHDTEGPDGQALALAESGAILFYLANKFARFVPFDPRGRIVTLQWIMFQMAHIGPMIGQLHHFMSSAPPGNEYSFERCRKEGERLLDVLNGRLAESAYLAGADYTIADICTWPWLCSWIHTTKQPLGARNALKLWYEAIAARPPVRKAIDVYNALRAAKAG